MTAAALPARRAVFLLLVLAVLAGLAALAVAALAPGGWSAAEVAILLCYLGAAPWSALSTANPLIGFALRMASRDPAGAVLPALRAARPAGAPRLSTAIAVCVRDEDMAQVLPPLARLLDGLEAAGAGHRFALWILSDTSDPALAAAEEAAVAAFAAARAGRPVPVRYRRRADNAGFKAGNVMDFLDRHAAGHDLFLALDADSAMAPATVLRLVACMEADPALAIVQPLIAGRPARAAFPRLFQFNMRQAMRVWATGQAWWQGGEGPYWGHNAILRIEPFRRHCRLAPLPGGAPVLSHDQVEATRLHAAGWKVCVLPEDEGSLEANPPAMPEFLARDRRWAAGNMQYLALLRQPGLSAMARWQLAQAVLLFAAAPLWCLALLLAVANAAAGGGAGTPPGALALFLGASLAAYYAAELLGHAEVLLKPALAARYGGRARFARGAAAAMLFALLFQPVRLVHQARFLLRLALGRGRAGWAPQNRAERGVAWSDAARLLWPETALGLALAAALAATSWSALLFALPFLAGLVLAVPLCVLTAAPGFSAWLARHRVAATPEELAAAAAPGGAAEPAAGAAEEAAERAPASAA
ncbi:glucans biosynthesis glucosyltransferase MdoH [Caldovatus aquaticus]|uniref:Glucans biosynthesis glucosyltransferase H n=1 Tax=Caldovatus aquaticus TaxID=2865671 RepID=A0ABS7F703_9PROT|nr:glucans biosynthesis glucosyltransferase MdoH [Caldovatus aquaticus]MBW8271234.1 glucans biosynthesis glucosyltransferase MdoH [Caldovatus aquaticus]